MKTLKMIAQLIVILGLAVAGFFVPMMLGGMEIMWLGNFTGGASFLLALMLFVPNEKKGL